MYQIVWNTFLIPAMHNLWDVKKWKNYITRQVLQVNDTCLSHDDCFFGFKQKWISFFSSYHDLSVWRYQLYQWQNDFQTKINRFSRNIVVILKLSWRKPILRKKGISHFVIWKPTNHKQVSYNFCCIWFININIKSIYKRFVFN